MPKYTVCLAVYAEKYITVEADDEESAKELAEGSDANEFSLCNFCSNDFELADMSGKAVMVELKDEEGSDERLHTSRTPNQVAVDYPLSP